MHTAEAVRQCQDQVCRDADGRFVFADPGSNLRLGALLILRERDYRHIPPRWRRSLFPVVFAPLVGQAGRGTEADPIVVRLAALCPVEFEFKGEGGAPELEIEVQFGSLLHSTVPLWGWEGGDILVDPRDRVRVLMPAGQLLTLRAVHGTSMLVRAFETSKACPDADPARATFTLPAPASISGQVFDTTGAPVSGGRLFAGFGTSNTPAAWQYEGEAAERLTRPDCNSVRLFAPTDPAQRLMLTSLVSRMTPIARDGRFVLPMPPDAMPDPLLHVREAGERPSMCSHRLTWTGESQETWSSTCASDGPSVKVR